MKVKVWFISWLIIVISALLVLGFWVYKIDPYFHYHKPERDNYFYVLDNQRSQNDGISQNFEYDAIISGTSMVENFRKTETDELFGCNAIKIPFAGGRYKEINDSIERSLKVNDDVKLVIRCLDMLEPYIIADDVNAMRDDLGNYPTYLYDNNIFNDVKYLLNRDVIFGRIGQMFIDKNKKDFEPGITSFDDYSRWQEDYTFGINTVISNDIEDVEPESGSHLTEEEKDIIKRNIENNVINVAVNNPDVEFYYFYSPYSIKSWGNWKAQDVLYKNLEIQAYMTELIVPHENIHLFAFSNRTDIITDLNNYTDDWHYAGWVNSLILKWMHDGKYQLALENYKDYFEQVYDFYSTFDYTSINDQRDYEADLYAAALLNKELTGVEPLAVLNDGKVSVDINGADDIRDNESADIEFNVNLDDGYNYLCFEGRKITNYGELTVYVYDEAGTIIRQMKTDDVDADNEVHQYVLDLSTANGNVTIVIGGEFVDDAEGGNSNYQISNVYMY